MAQKRLFVDALIKQTLKKEDQVILPDVEDFYIHMHNKIMNSVSQTDIKTFDKWSKPWVFLEQGVDLKEGSVKLNRLK